MPEPAERPTALPAKSTDRTGPLKLPPIVPRPNDVTAGSGFFRLAADTPILLPTRYTLQDEASAAALCAGISRRCGAELAVEAHYYDEADGETRRADDLPAGPRAKGADPEIDRGARDIARSGFEGATLERRIELRISPALDGHLPDGVRGQSYRLEVTRDFIRATGASSAGLRYAVETLVQLVDPHGRVASCCVTDAPTLELRGIMLDVSRGKVPTPDSIKALIELCASLKLNVLMLYTEHTFRFRRHPDIGRHDSPLDSATMRMLDAFAAAHGVELVPTLQSLGHMEHVLKLPAYRDLAESERGWTIAPSEPGTYPLLRDLYDEYLPNFRSSLFNANCDEPWDLGKGKSADLFEALGPGGLYLEHVRRIRELAKRHGKRTMIWGDVVHAHPERIPEIDRDLILLDWWYEADCDYDRVEVFAQSGLEFLVCPGTSTWNSLFPRVGNCIANISGWADAGRRHGARGLINTDWGDHGHYNLQGNSFFAYAWGAQESWSGPCDAGYFDRAFSRALFGDARGEVAKLYRALGAIHDPGFPMFNGSALQYLFFDDIETAYFIKATKPGKLKRALAKLEKLRPRIEAAIPRCTAQRDTLHELLYAADASILALSKAMAGLEYIDWRRRQGSLRAAGRRKLARQLESLAHTQLSLGKRLRQLWLARAMKSNLADTERRLRRSAQSLRRGARALERNAPSAAPIKEPITGQGVLEAARASLGR